MAGYRQKDTSRKQIDMAGYRQKDTSRNRQIWLDTDRKILLEINRQIDPAGNRLNEPNVLKSVKSPNCENICLEFKRRRNKNRFQINLYYCICSGSKV